ncbi:MAG TPA: hypothetical protein VN446_02930 [Candidatus Acidoferrum sp.]|nr:hypothetical protein [Candidatus Acidoferrum sp.]
MNGEQDMPLGLKMAIARNFESMKKYAGLSDLELDALITGASEIDSKDAMEAYVDNFLEE